MKPSLRALSWKPADRDQLHAWLRTNLQLDLPQVPLCPHHSTPFDYLQHAFFEFPGDSVVWACRGGGKTFLGAVATLLDLLHKPGIQIRILGGSLEQSDKMYAYLRQLITTAKLEHFLKSAPTGRKLTLHNNSRVEILAQSDTSVRGQRIQKLRCDEVELFDPNVWSAAQLVTRSAHDAFQFPIKASIEAFSTMHIPNGLMQSLITPPATSPRSDPARGVLSAPQNPRKIYQWCIWDVIERCPEERSCETCPLHSACQGRAKNANGFLRIDDLIAQRSRVSASVWNHEMLCLPPRFDNAVFPTFDPALHVALPPKNLRPERIIAGIDFGYVGAFACIFVAISFDSQKRLRVHILDELITREVTLQRALQKIQEKKIPIDLIACDPAGNAPNEQTGIPNTRILKSLGIPILTRASRIAEGLAHIESLLSPADAPTLTPDTVRLHIHPQCTTLITAFQSYRRNPDGTPLKDGTSDHPLDALRYALINHHPTPQLKSRNY